MHDAFLATQQRMQHQFLHTRQAFAAQLLGFASAPPHLAAPPAPVTAPPLVPGLLPEQEKKPAPAVQARSTPAPAPAPAASKARPVAPSPQKSAPPKLKKAPLSSAHVIKPGKPAPVGPTFDYTQILEHASGKISNVFGPLFAQQDDFPIQVRMPEPPLLLCHRITGIDCEPGEVGTGTLWCESDIPADAWFLHNDRMPTGIMIESGQADLMLISWMGADFENLGKRCYRLLGCELTFHGGLARPNDTLVYDIHIDGHARQNDIRLFFFHYDCEVEGTARLSVRNGQAGFFTYDELKESKGILWTPGDEDADAIAATPFELTNPVTARRSFGAQEVQRFAEGEVWEIFGEGFERAAAHTASPTIQADRMRFMDEVLEFDPHGGPWNRGYLKARQHIHADDWFFDGHFKNDPCMPGTLMFEGCVQTMAFYMAACGFTIDRDGWAFEPVPDLPYTLRCRGQVSTTSRELIYEVFVREVHDGDTPRLFADLLCTVDGLGAFHCSRMGLQLVPDWPMDQLTDMDAYIEPKPVATVNGFEFGYDSLIACALGKPTRAFGPMYAPFDSHRTVARLPGPPYHFISRVTDIDPTAQNAMRSKVDLTVEYDVPKDAWYFSDNGAPVMPYAVLLEAALQPCGWLASYIGCALTRDDIDLAFRNLDGTTTQFMEVTPELGTLETHAHLKNVARAGGNIIVSFLVEMRAMDLPGAPLVLTMDTVFGFFPPESLAAQIGLPSTGAFKTMAEASSDFALDLTARPPAYCEGSLRLAEPKLLMIDRITGYWPEAGEAGLGQLRAEKDVDPNEWFFKAHFFQDPVQPGSLGLEALLQLLQFGMLEKGLAQGVENPRFEAIAIDKPMTWKYRGQVVPTNSTITSTLELTELGEDERGTYALATGSLWVDGMRIYHATNIGMRIVPSGRASSARPTPATPASTDDKEEDRGAAPEPHEHIFSMSLEQDPWLGDHRPTYTAPAMPMMSIIDLMAQQAQRAAPAQHVVEVRDVVLEKWLIFDGPKRLRTRATPTQTPNQWHVSLELWWDAPRAEMSRFDTIAHALITMGEQWRPAPDPFTALKNPAPVEDLYESAELFHGPAFQVVQQTLRGEQGATATLLATSSGVPVGALNPALLDGALQSIPHDRMELWWEGADGDSIAYPHGLEQLSVHSETPTQGELTAHVRFLGGDDRLVRFGIQIFAHGALWVSMTFGEILMPKGPLGRLEPLQRRAFIAESAYVEGASLSQQEDSITTISMQEVMQSNWFKGTLEQVYGYQTRAPKQILTTLAVKDHFAQKLGAHPSQVRVNLSEQTARLKGLEVLVYDFDAQVSEHKASVRGAARARLDADAVKQWWQHRLGMQPGWFGDDLYGGLIERFVSSVRVQDAGALAKLNGRSVLFLANHEVQIESLLITILSSALTDTTTVTMANAKHERGWVGQLIRDIFSYPECADPRNIVYFDQQDRESMFTLLEGLKNDVTQRNASIMVHAPGTRATRAGEPVRRISSLFLDLAIELQLPVVPVYFDGGLPAEPLSAGKLEFPLHQTGQSYTFGRPILPEELGALPYAERRACVLDGINALAPDQKVAQPNPPRDERAQEIQAWQAHTQKDEINATLLNILQHLPDPGQDTQRILDLGGGKKSFESLSPAQNQWLTAMAKRFFA